jgi:hypothetical protein
VGIAVLNSAGRREPIVYLATDGWVRAISKEKGTSTFSIGAFWELGMSNLAGSKSCRMSVVAGKDCVFAANSGYIYKLSQFADKVMCVDNISAANGQEVRLAMDGGKNYLYAATNGWVLQLNTDDLSY